MGDGAGGEGGGRMKTAKPPVADVCLILEGTYPYIAGGVSTWTHDLIRGSKDISFHIVSLLPKDEPPPMRYELPANVTGRPTTILW